MILRLGYTESTLFLYYFIKNIIKQSINNNFIESEKTLINWLYTTSGFYDKKIEGDYFNFNYEKCINSIIYNLYMEKLHESIKNSKKTIINFHGQTDTDEYSVNCKKLFIDYFSKYTEIILYNQSIEDFFNFIKNKKILIINPFASLMKFQYEKKIMNNIYEYFPFIETIHYYENPYTFFNKGPNNNILDTCSKIVNDIINLKVEYNAVVIACGAYSCILANLIFINLNKEIYVTGGNLSSYFGIKSNRNKNEYNEYWISIPEKYKPINYKKIEDGCYW